MKSTRHFRVLFYLTLYGYQTNMQQKRAFIVDDEKDTCFLLKGILQQQGFVADFVHSLTDAKISASLPQADVIFLDNHLKDGHGIDFVPYLAQHYPELKIIIITAFDTDHDKQNAYLKGAHHFMGKPFNRNIIAEALSVIFPL